MTIWYQSADFAGEEEGSNLAELGDLTQKVADLTGNLNNILGLLTKLETWIPAVDAGMQGLNKAVKGISARVSLSENAPPAALFMVTPLPVGHCKEENYQGGASRTYEALHSVETWLELCVAVHSKFGKDKYQEHLEDLESLRQTGNSKFEELMDRVLVYNQAYGATYFVTKFVGGLKTEIKATIKLHKPRTVDAALSLAKT